MQHFNAGTILTPKHFFHFCLHLTLLFLCAVRCNQIVYDIFFVLFWFSTSYVNVKCARLTMPPTFTIRIIQILSVLRHLSIRSHAPHQINHDSFEKSEVQHTINHISLALIYLCISSILPKSSLHRPIMTSSYAFCNGAYFWNCNQSRENRNAFFKHFCSFHWNFAFIAFSIFSHWENTLRTPKYNNNLNIWYEVNTWNKLETKFEITRVKVDSEVKCNRFFVTIDLE